ncbi:S-layer homology domain-containing protein [Paenibacillus sp. GCM10027628]|uniref:S-layer homology domain-containing protein n=1 Tax=Paenibacillus sp. GCM10027628 TaxID=3273413 RepID=UPI00363C2DEF
MIKMKNIAILFLFTLIILPLGTANASASNWGVLGSRPGDFYNPLGLDVDVQENVYVADTQNHRIQIFDANGNFQSTWGIEGTGEGELSSPADLAVSVSGYVYVADSGNGRIQVFHSDGTFVASLGRKGSGEGEFLHPASIDVNDSTGKIYVADSGNDRIQILGADGFEKSWGSHGSGPGELLNPSGIALGPDGSVYVADTGNHRVQQFTADGVFVRSWGRLGNGAAEFSSPIGIAVDPYGQVYVADTGNHRVKQFSATGDFLKAWGGLGSGEEQFDAPAGLAAASDGLAYVADTNLQRIQKLRIDYPPEATGVKVSGSATVGQAVYGEYHFNDQDGDLESHSAYRWYRSTNAAGSDAVAIAGAEGTTYTLQPEDEGLYIAFEVTPMSDSGAKQGKAAKSSFIGPVTQVANRSPIRRYELADQTIIANGPTYSQDVHDWFTDPDSDTLSWSVQIDHPEVADVVLDGTTLSLKPKAGGSAIVTVTVSDGKGGTADDSFIVTVVPASSNNNPPGDLRLSSTEVVEGADIGTIVGWLQAFDPEGDALSYLLTAGSGDDDNGSFRIVGNMLVTAEAVTKKSYSIRVGVSDGRATVEQAFTITVTNVDRSAPVIKLLGGAIVTLQVGDTFTEPGVTVTDDSNVDLISKVVVGGDQVDTSKAGTYVVTYNVRDAAGNAAMEVTRTVTVEDAGTLAGPQVIVAVGGDRQVTLNWETVTGATYYKIYMANTPDQFGQGAVGTVTDNTYTVHNLTNGTTYYFAVKAGYPVGLSRASNAVSATPATVPAPPANVTALQSLMLTNGILLPSFQSSTTDYKVTVANSVYATTITASVYDPNSKITINGQAAVSGVGNPMNLKVGDNQIVLKVTAPDGVTQGTYTVHVKRLPSSNSILTDLNVSAGSLIPSFSSGTLNYILTVPNGVSTTTVTSFVYDPAATILINGILVESGKASAPIELQVGTNTVTVTAVAQDGITETIYTITVTRLAYRQETDSSGSTDSTGPLPSQTTGEPDQNGTAPVQNTSTKSVIFDPSDPASVAKMKKTLLEMIQVGQSRPVAEFKDVKNHWADKNIKLFTKLGVVNGYSDGNFKPDGLITRVEFSTMIAKIFALKKSAETPVQFTDITNNWAKDSIESLASHHIINGYEDGSFKPDRYITRAEMVTIMTRIINMNAVRGTGSTNFVDINNSWAKEQIQTAARAGIVIGGDHQDFAPDKNTTRAEAITVILRSMETNSEIATLLRAIQ